MINEDNSEVLDPESEPAAVNDIPASHNITEGGLIGAASGAILGMLAGGPIGAVVGAVIGGGASAVAVDLIEHRDREAETVDLRPEHSGDATGLSEQADQVITTPQPLDRSYTVEAVPDLAVITVAADEGAVRLRAYALYVQRGRQDGYADRDWFDAENEILYKLSHLDNESAPTAVAPSEAYPVIVEEVDDFIR